MEQFFGEAAKAYGLPIAMLLVAVYALNRNSKEAYARLDQERKERLDEHAARMTELSRHVDQCNEDRRKLWQMLGGKTGE